MPNPSRSKRPEPDAAAPGDPVFEAALAAVRDDRAAVLAGIVGVQGSSPREVGAHMLITADRIVGTVGGGVLEHMVVGRARAMLREAMRCHCLLSFPLGPDSQQCCGGVVTLFLEPLAHADRVWLQRLTAPRLRRGVGIVTRLGLGPEKTVVDEPGSVAELAPEVARWLRRRAGCDATLISHGRDEFLCQYLAQPGFDVALFGAGHVGRALAAALAAQRCRLLWIDSRRSEFPRRLPANARMLISDDVGAALAQVAPGSMVLVMTHRHPLDYEICRAVLERGDCRFLGLIGSVTKRRRFTKALLRDGLEPGAVERLCCPIGIPGLKGKEPPVIAASVVAQLLLLAQADAEAPATAIGIRERDADRSCVGASF